MKSKQMELGKSITVSFGHIQAQVFGGPFRSYVPGTRRLVGVKMAAEIDHPHDISIPTEDFSIPFLHDMEAGLVKAIAAMARGNDIYAGCMGGIGRTGLFMGCLAKAINDYNDLAGAQEAQDPVAFVRAHYIPHAIETSAQQAFVRDFYSSEVLAAMIAASPLPVAPVASAPAPVVEPSKASLLSRLVTWARMRLA